VMTAAQHRAAALAEALPDGIVDAHHHVWDLSNGHYPWLQDEYAGDRFFLGPYQKIRRDYTAADLRRDQAPLHLAASVHIEAERDRADQIGETRWLEQVNGETGLPSVVIGHVSFLQPDLTEALRAHAVCPLFRGIRCKPVTAASPAESIRGQPGTLQDEAWLAGLGALAAMGLSWDLRVPFWHLREAADAVAAFPGMIVIVNHCGLPIDRSPEALAIWRRGLQALADHQSVFLKLSEFGLHGGRWDGAGTARLVREATAIFGHDRVMYGSNLPVSSLSASVPTIVDAILDGLGTCDPDILRAVFSANARRAYRIEPNKDA
jgi:predicted TIM-barrel fold metal-dependent hydrolase